MWLLSDWSLVNDLEAELLPWHLSNCIAHYEQLLQLSQLAVVSGPLGLWDGIELDLVRLVISCKGCLLGHVLVPDLVLSQPVLPSLWWLPHSFFNGVTQGSYTWDWDVIWATFH